MLTEAELLKAYLAERDVACPGCGYNLKGCVTEKCPECGSKIGIRVQAQAQTLWWLPILVVTGWAAMIAYLAIRFIPIWRELYVRFVEEGWKPDATIWIRLLLLHAPVAMAIAIVVLALPWKMTRRDRNARGIWQLLGRLLVIHAALSMAISQVLETLIFWVPWVFT